MSSQGESRSTPTALEAAIDCERCKGEAGPHAALQQYAQLDRRVRAALDFPALPDAPNPDAFELARTVAYLFKRFLNACAEAGVDSSAPWIQAVAEAEEAITADKNPAEPQALDEPPTPSHSPAQELEGEHAAAARSPSPSVANKPVIDSAPSVSTPGREPSSTALATSSPSGQSDPSSSTQADLSPSTQADPSSTSTSTQASTSTSNSHPTPTSTSTSTSTSTPTIDAARPHIRALLSVPDLDWTTLSTKDVRAQLVARGVGFDAAWVWERRRELRTVIEEEFDAAHTRWQAAQAAANPSAASPSQSGPAASGASTAPPPPKLDASLSADASSPAAQPHADTEDKLEAVRPSDGTPTKRRSIVPPRRPSSHSSQTHAEDGAVAPSAEDQAVAPVGPAEDAAVASAVAAEHEDIAPDTTDLESAPTKRAKKRKVVSLLKSKLEPTSPIPRSTRSSTRRNLKGLSVLSRIQQSEIAVRSLPARETTQQGPNSPSSAPPTSGTGIKLRIPSLAARQAKSASKSPLPATSPKRKRSPTPDSDEDEFAASFMRKRKVSAAAV